MMKCFVGFVLLLGSAGCLAKVPESCLATAMTQSEMNACASSDLDAVQAEMERVIVELEAKYASDGAFIDALHRSQEAWKRSRDANLEMRYPQADKQREYGSVYPMCQSEFLRREIMQRLAFLKEWLKGSEQGDACSGSM